MTDKLYGGSPMTAERLRALISVVPFGVESPGAQEYFSWIADFAIDAQAELESLRASLTRVEEENAAIREAQHKLKSSVHYIAGFLETTARRHERGELSANEYTQRLTDCAVILLEANAEQHTARLSRASVSPKE